MKHSTPWPGPPFAAAMAPTISPGADTPLAPLLRADVRRALAVQPLWIVGGTLFYWMLERAGRPDTSVQFGFWLNLLAWVMGDAVGLGVVLAAWYGLANHWWRRSEAARIRYTREGMYAMLPWRVGLPLLAVTVALSGLLAYAGFVALVTWMGAMTPARRAAISVEGSMVFHFFGMSTIIVVDMLRVRARKQRLLAEQAQRLQVEARLQALQAQLEPHMLFNTLANLHALIDTQPAKAQDMLAHLIDHLRGTLSASRQGAIRLGDEVAQVMSYVHLMQIRMGDRLKVRVDIPERLHDWLLPPMLLQPLVENALKHGLEPMPAGGCLRIHAWEQAGTLHVAVTDDGRGLAAAAAPGGTGFGLACVQARLQACWGPAAQLVVANAPSGTGTVSTLTLPGPAAPGAH